MASTPVGHDWSHQRLRIREKTCRPRSQESHLRLKTDLPSSFHSGSFATLLAKTPRLSLSPNGVRTPASLEIVNCTSSRKIPMPSLHLQWCSRNTMPLFAPRSSPSPWCHRTKWLNPPSGTIVFWHRTAHHKNALLLHMPGPDSCPAAS